jgi:hypothetical protein
MFLSNLADSANVPLWIYSSQIISNYTVKNAPADFGSTITGSDNAHSTLPLYKIVDASNL